jgi:hypothetical protein
MRVIVTSTTQKKSIPIVMVHHGHHHYLDVVKHRFELYTTTGTHNKDMVKDAIAIVLMVFVDLCLDARVRKFRILRSNSVMQ